MRIKLNLLICFCLLGITAFTQEKWSLPKCVQYAMDSNISIRQNEIQAELAGITTKQSRLSQIPGTASRLISLIIAYSSPLNFIDLLLLARLMFTCGIVFFCVHAQHSSNKNNTDLFILKYRYLSMIL